MRQIELSTFGAVCEEMDRRRHIALGFERIEALLSLLGDPHRSLRMVQVVGTNGKGTTTAALAAALEAAGQPSGAYLSPHVLSYTERVRIGGAFVSEEEFAAAMGETIGVADAHGVAATQFEILTAGAIKMFRDRGLAWAILEAGLGARYDATSAAGAEAVVLTNVGLDHTEYLGGTVEEIALEKLATLRPGSLLVLGTDDERVVAVAHRESARVEARLLEHETGLAEDPATAGFPAHLASNARLGMRAAEALLGRLLEREERAAAASAALGLPGRFEEHEIRGVPVVVDGGHNPEGLAATLGAVRKRYRERPLGVVFGVLKDKDVGSMLALVKNEAALLVLTRPVGAGERAADPSSYVRAHDPRDTGGGSALVIQDAGEALRVAVEQMEGAGGVVLATGSLYTAADVLTALRRGGGRDGVSAGACG